MNNQVLESLIEKAVNKYVRYYGVLCEKVRFVESGFPDRLYILPSGLNVWIEYKRKDEKPKNHQIYRMMQLRRNLQIVGWTDEFSSTIDFIKGFLVPPRIPKESYYTATVSSFGGPLSGPWIRENFYLPRILQNIKGEGIFTEGTDYCPS